MSEDLKNTINAYKSISKNLFKFIDELKKENLKLKELRDNLNNEVMELSAENQSLVINYNNDVETFKEITEDLEGQIKNLTRKNKTLKRDNKILKADYKTIQIENKTLENDTNENNNLFLKDWTDNYDHGTETLERLEHGDYEIDNFMDFLMDIKGVKEYINKYYK